MSRCPPTRSSAGASGSRGSAAGDVAGAGQEGAEHPLLGAAISLPGEEGEEGGLLLTGRLSLQAGAWLGDHAVHGVPILAGTALVEMALTAAERVGAGSIEELTMAAPLILPERGAVQIQVRVGEPGPDGRRELAIHSRPEGVEAAWTANAAGSLAALAPPPSGDLGEWPPPGAEPVAVTGFYERAAELGVEYGPAFQGLRAAWRRGEELFAEVELAEEQAAEAERFAIHPALLDAAGHPIMLGAERAEGAPSAPFAWSGIALHGAGAAALRVRIAPAAGSGLSLLAADAAGAPLFEAAAVTTRPLAPEQLGTTRGGSLFALEWNAIELPEEEAAAARIDCLADPAFDPPAAAAALGAEVLSALQEAIADEEGGRLAFVTQGAMAVVAGESPDPAAAAVWGLVRSAQAEHPGRFLLIDSDGSEASEAALERALALADEPQLALREGAASVPRLARLAPSAPESAPALDPERTVLVTGATGALGSLFARHLIEAHGVRHLLLASRRGPEAPGAEELRAELEELGAEATLAACDVGDREQLAALLAAIPAGHPLGMVVHCAGVTEDDLIESQGPAHLATAMGPKADAAWHLHELTAEIEGCELVLFSSVAAPFGYPGQANYAAANSFLDALAQRRRAAGLRALALGWGGWEAEGERVAQLGEADRARLARGGIVPLAAAEGLALFDRARADGAAYLVAAALDTGALRAQARAGTLRPVLSGLVRMPRRRAAAASGSLAARLAAAPAAERDGIVSELVRSHAAAVLGHAGAAAIDPAAPFKDLGFDSLAAVELRNRLDAATGLRLPATLVFDYPTAAAVAGFLRTEAEGTGAAPAVAVAPVRAEEPIAIVGMSCRYPGGVALAGAAVAAARRRRRGPGAVPGRPRLGRRRPLRPRSGPAREDQRRGRRLPRGGDRVRRRLLRDQPARGALDGPAAAAAAGSRLGGAGGSGHRSGGAARQPHRRLRRPDAPRLRPRRLRLDRARRPAGSGLGRQRRLRPPRLLVRARGPRGHRRHRLLLFAGCDPPRLPGAARGRVLDGPRRRRHRPRDPGPVHRIQPPARPRLRWPLQVVRGGRRRRRDLRGGRAGPAGAALGGRSQRARGAGDDPRLGDQPGRRLQRHDRPQRPGAGAGDHAGAGQLGPAAGRGRRGRGARHRHRPRRPDRGRGAARHLRPGTGGRAAAGAGLGQVEPRPHPGGGGGGRVDQDGPGAAPPDASPQPPPRRADAPRRLVGRGGRAAERGEGVGGQRPSPPRRRLLLRHVRHQRPSDSRGGAAGGGGGKGPGPSRDPPSPRSPCRSRPRASPPCASRPRAWPPTWPPTRR